MLPDDGEELRIRVCDDWHSEHLRLYLTFVNRQTRLVHGARKSYRRASPYPQAPWPETSPSS
jgi:hypothetical protein